ncbi:MAG: hypothetical protein QOG66_1575 [Methylobacteriaceae bacterium]|jgi:hypothetical protein|nr:hypothetical protein [Methylobacteriaceae bacterium]
MKISNPVNDVQRRFNELCAKGGGTRGGPARGKVQELLWEASLKLNELAFTEITTHLHEFADRNPWHVCFAVGLGWGHLAQIHPQFTDSATRVLESLDSSALETASTYHLERGPLPIQQSLRGGHLMFQKVRLPDGLPTTLEQYGRAQERWFQPLLSKSETRPKYIGSWNATAMFMVGLFAEPELAKTLKNCQVVLPPGGPIQTALSILYAAHILKRRPAGTELDDESFEPGALYENNALIAELLLGTLDWSMIDVHSGLYMLGTRYAPSSKWA